MGWGEPVFGGVWLRDDRRWDLPHPRGKIPLDSGLAPPLRIEGMGCPYSRRLLPFDPSGGECRGWSWTSSAMAPSLSELVVPWLLPSERVAWREWRHGLFPPSGRHWMSGAMDPL